MQLTGIQSLRKDYTSNDLNEMAAVMQSTLLSSPSAILRWSKVTESEAQSWMRATVTSSLKKEFQIPRMSAALDRSARDLPTSSYAEHLIIRDLDMEHIEDPAKNDAPGRVVAHADWRYTPRFEGSIADTPQDENGSSDEVSSHPQGFNKELDKLLNDRIDTSIAAHFNGLPFFYLLGISTLTPSHLRKGVAKRLVEWVEPFVHYYSVPVVLYASPLGLHLYRNCGYEEYRDLDVTIDLEPWGVRETHRHVVMIRWPKEESHLPEAWMRWKKTYAEDRPLTNTK